MYTYNQFRSGQNAFDKGLNRSISSDAVEMQSLGDISDINAEEQYSYGEGYCVAIDLELDLDEDFEDVLGQMKNEEEVQNQKQGVSDGFIEAPQTNHWPQQVQYLRDEDQAVFAGERDGSFCADCQHDIGDDSTFDAFQDEQENQSFNFENMSIQEPLVVSTAEMATNFVMINTFEQPQPIEKVNFVPPVDQLGISFADFDDSVFIEQPPQQPMMIDHDMEP